jgi:Carbohydrate/starch-binding module (family 21)
MKLARKKSGEVVKSALHHSSQTSSPPAPLAKKVRFNENLEQVRHFFEADCTVSISADSSPINGNLDEQEDRLIQPFLSNGSSSQSTPWEATVINFSRASNGDRQFVQFDKVYLSTDNQNLIGAVNVANIAFEKQVAARFTLDDWQTVSEITAEYKSTEPVNTYDQFQFTIALPAQADLRIKSILLCIRYRVDGQEFWDNNSGKNYIINFNRKLPLPKYIASDDYDTPASHLNNRFSDRYNFATSLRATSTLLATHESTRYVSESTEVRKSFGASSTPMNHNRSKLDLSSPAYNDMIQKLCYFRPEDATDSFDRLTRLIYPWLTDESTSLFQVQSLHNPSVYLDQSLQASHVIHCF